MSEHDTRRNDKHYLFQLLKIKQGVESVEGVIAQYSASMNDEDVESVNVRFKSLIEEKK
ncbi:MAG: hypothetical protein FWE74_01235 [Oscillospiraceae bacterium]|nr:hypothetical protein [Oscillospiraceae bacterium]